MSKSYDWQIVVRQTTLPHKFSAKKERTRCTSIGVAVQNTVNSLSHQDITMRFSNIMFWHQLTESLPS